jgi:hypothetical protein
LNNFADIGPLVDASLREWSAGLSSGNGGPGPKNEISDPTGNQATSRDEFGLLRSRVFEHVMEIHRRVVELDRIGRVVVDKPVEQVTTPIGLSKCSNALGCPDDAWAEKAGQCAPCRQHFIDTGRYRK